MSEWEKRLEQPSVPLVAKGPPGPPKIVEIEKKYSAIEGSILFTLHIAMERVLETLISCTRIHHYYPYESRIV